MTHYFCIAVGPVEGTERKASGVYAPTELQTYYFVDSEADFRAIVDTECGAFDAEHADAYKTAFRMPGEGVNNYSQRLRSARYDDRVLDVIGMTESEYEREQGE